MQMEGTDTISKNNTSESSSEGLKINLEQMQLNELQKISSQLDSQRISGSTPISSVGPNAIQTSFSGIKINGHQAGGVISSQPINNANPYAYSPYGAPATPNDALFMSQLANTLARALSLTINPNNDKSIASKLTSMKEEEKNFLDKAVDKVSNFPLIKYRGIDYSRTNSKGVEAILEQAEFSTERAGLQIATAGASLAGGAIGGKVGSAAGAAIGTALIPIPGVGTAIGSIAGSMLGYSAGSGLVEKGGDILMHQMKDRQSYSTFLQENASKFINSSETNNRTVNSGFTSNERRDLSRWLANINTEFFMSDDEINTILHDVTDAGLMKSVSDVETFKKKFTSLVDTVKKGAKMLNTSYEEMTQMIADLNKEGIKTSEQQQAALDRLKAVSDLTGQDATEVYQATEGTKSLLYSNTSVDPNSAFMTSSNLNLLSSTFMDSMSQAINGPDGDKVKKAFGFTYNQALNNNWDSTQLAQQMAIANGTILDANSPLGQVAPAFLAYAANFKGGVITGFDKEKLAEIESYLNKGDLQGANQLYQNWASSDTATAGTILQQLQNNGGVTNYALLADSAGVQEAGKFVNAYNDALAYNDGMIDKSTIGKSEAAAVLATHMGADQNLAKMAYEYNAFSYSDTGSQALQNQANNEETQAIRRYSSNDDSVNFIERAKAWGENLLQDASGIINWNTSFLDNAKNFFSGKDTAQRAGYGSASFVASSYEDVYNQTTDLADLYEKAGVKKGYIGISDYSDMDIKKTITGDLKLTNDSTSIIDSAKNILPFVKGNSTKDMRKTIEGNKDLTDEEKQKLLANISTSEGQTQSAVAGYLDIALDLGGKEFRKEFIDSVRLEGFGKNKSLDDLANISNIQNLSLDAQKSIQAFLPKAVAQKLSSSYSNEELLDMFKDRFGAGTGQLLSNETYQQAISDSKLTTEEIEKLVNVLQEKAYTNSSGADYADSIAQDAQKYLQQNGEIGKEINDNLKTNNDTASKTSDLIKESNEKQAKFNDDMTKHIKTLDQQITALNRG